MADETKRTPSDQQGAQGGNKPPADKAAIPEKPKVGEGSGQDALAKGAQPPPKKPLTAGEQGVAPGKAGDAAQGKDPAKVQPTPPAGGTSGAPHAGGAPTPPPKPTGPAATPWEHERVVRLKSAYGSGIKEALTYLGQNYLIVNKESA